MEDIGDFIIGFFEGAIASSPTLRRIFLWILFSISILLSFVPVVTGEYAWSILSISAMLFSVVMIDDTRKHSVHDAKNGGAYHYFLLTVGTLCVAAIVLLAPWRVSRRLLSPRRRTASILRPGMWRRPHWFFCCSSITPRSRARRSLTCTVWSASTGMFARWCWV